MIHKILKLQIVLQRWQIISRRRKLRSSRWKLYLGNSVALNSTKMTPLLCPRGAFVSADPRPALRSRIRERNKSATSGYEKPCDGWCDSCHGKLSRNAALSLSLPFYFNQPLSLSSSPFHLSLSLSCLSLSPRSSPTWHPRSLHQAPITRAHRFACHPVGGRSNQSRSRRAARPFSKFSRCPR